VSTWTDESWVGDLRCCCDCWLATVVVEAALLDCCGIMLVAATAGVPTIVVGSEPCCWVDWARVWAADG